MRPARRQPEPICGHLGEAGRGGPGFSNSRLRSSADLQGPAAGCQLAWRQRGRSRNGQREGEGEGVRPGLASSVLPRDPQNTTASTGPR